MNTKIYSNKALSGLVANTSWSTARHRLKILIFPEIDQEIKHVISRFILTLFLFLPIHMGYSQSDCATTHTSTFYHDNMNGAGMGTYDDPLVIRLYIHLVRQVNGAGGVNSTNLQEQINWLNLWYNPHNLFFDYCISEVICEDCWISGTPGLSAIKDLYTTNSLDDGINCYLFPPDFSQTAQAEDVGSKNCLSRVSYTTTAHEIGHCLGLFHTFESNGCPPTSVTENSPYYNQSQILVNGNNCESTGDMICDTPADFPCYSLVSGCTFSNPTQILDYAGHPFIDPNNVLPKNIMSYWTCRQEFTPGQNIRMRDVLADDMVIGQVVSPFSHIRTVTGTEVWTTPKHFNHDLVINGSLTISTTVGFSAGCGIILNGSLDIDGGTLTLSTFKNSCPISSNGLWKGILINRSSTITPTLDISNNSIIEHADQAIYFNGPGNQFVIASNSDFKNNRITYNNIRSANGPAKFTNCDFTINSSYKLVSYFPQISSVHSAPILIGGCIFDFEPTLPASVSRQAISSFDGQILVTKWNNVRSRFENWSKGVRAFQNIGTKLTLVRNADFIGNWRAIDGFDFHRLMVYENNFDISNDVISDEGFGIYAIGARQLNFHHNEFSSTESEVLSTGIYNIGSGSEKVAISECDFTDLDIAVDAFNAGGPSGGLTFLCNRNEGNRLFDFRAEFGIGPVHGTKLKPAGNAFSHTDNLDHDTDFRAVNLNGNYRVDYYYDRTVVNQNPLYISSSIDKHMTGEKNCDHFILLQSPVDSTELSDFFDTNDELLIGIADKQDELNGLGLTATQIRDLNAELSCLQLQHDANANHAVAFVLTRDTIDYDDLRTAIDLRDGFQFAVAKAFTYLGERDTTAMFEELESIPYQISLTQNEEDDLMEILLLDSMLHRVYLEGRIEDELSGTELDTVEYIAEEGVGIARDHARALLCYFYEQCYDETISLQYSEEPIISDVSGAQDLKPESDKYSDQEEEETISYLSDVIIYSMDGRLVKSLQLETDQFNSTLLWAQGLPEGLYVMVCTTDHGNEVYLKWVR